MVLSIVLGVLAVLSLGLALWQWGAAWRFPLHQRQAPAGFEPGVTLLKPLKGCDPTTQACLRSWLEQEYSGPIQILFGVESPEDPVCQVVQELRAEFPKADAELVIAQPLTGINAKVSKLAWLARQARHEYWVISDADVQVPADLLCHLMAPFQESDVGLVNCFYGLANPCTLAMRWEAVAMNADFWSQVLQSRLLGPLDFALGAVMAVPRRWMEKIGGFSRLENHLADDYQLGHEIAQGGGKIVLCPIVAECWSNLMGWRQVWNHQLRWARTIRICRPVSYALSALSNCTLWLLLWIISTPRISVALAALAGLAIRIFIANRLQQRLMPSIFSWRYSWLIPVKDLLQVGLWAMAFLGNRVRWHGKVYRVQSDGRLVRLED
jgi:ceramide glucosyltransferase